MPSKLSQHDWAPLVSQHLEQNVSIADICRANPELKKSTLRYHIKKAKGEPKTKVNITLKSDQKQEEAPEPNLESAPASAPAPAPAPASSTTVIDSFLQDYTAPKHSTVDNLFSLQDIKSNKPEAPKALGKSKNWWLSSKSEPKKQKESTTTQEESAGSNNCLVLIQKMRLYFVHFPELSKLHIVPRKKGSEEPDTEKWLISLYTKKESELDKLLSFVRFHVRNQINSHSTIALATNALETGVKILEHVLMTVGVQSRGLTKTVMADDDVRRCVKEILIDHSVSSLNLGAKCDLMLKLGMKVVSTDSSNRISALSAMPPTNPEVLKKYSDL